MPEFSTNEQLIIDYLLGDLPEAEAGRLDALSVINDEFALFLETVENEFIDDYIRKELPENRRARFGSYYLTTPERREKVALARKILQHADTDEILWRSDVQQSINQTIVVKVPSKIFKSQDYVLEVSGIAKNGNAEIISGYPFHILFP